MEVSVNQIIQALWIAMFAIWFFTGFSVKQTAQSRSEGMSRIAVYIVWIGWWLLFAHGFGRDPLARRMYPPSMSIGCIGLAITAAGLVFAVLARLYIGKNWSPLIHVKEGHELIQSGPYAVVRHPIYSGRPVRSTIRKLSDAGERPDPVRVVRPLTGCTCSLRFFGLFQKTLENPLCVTQYPGTRPHLLKSPYRVNQIW
ncbi:MAG TPA: isoprenylcysteine carboxylmethyltransferase family protein [Terriglobia bacterium]|jgi:hypothetical protein